MSSFKAFDIAGSGMAAQSVRLNTTASNLANADSVSSTPAGVYKARHPIFEAVRGDLIRAVHTVRTPADVAALVANDLEPAVLEMRPELAGVLEQLRGGGALAAAVSGSGPTVFGIFEHAAAARAAAERIEGSIVTSPV